MWAEGVRERESEREGQRVTDREIQRQTEQKGKGDKIGQK